MPKITESLVQRMSATGKQQSVHDNGLLLVVQPSGRKSFYYVNRYNGKQRKQHIGKYGKSRVAMKS